MHQTAAQKGAKLSAFDKITPIKHGVLTLGGDIRLARGRIHEVMGDAADMFAVAAASAASGPIVWVGSGQDVGSLAPTGLSEFLNPARVIAVTCLSRQEVLWASEQALRAPGASCVIAELDDGPDLKTSRRLQIAAEESGALGLILIAGRAQTSAAQTRWDCGAIDHPETPYQWRLIKNKTGNVGYWRVGFSPTNGRDESATGIVTMAAATAA